MTEHFVIISFYTPDTGYEVSARDRLIPSLEKFDLDYRAHPLPSRGSWLANCHAKAEVLGYWMERLPHNLVWLDADAEVCSEPARFEYHCTNLYDFAAHWRFGARLSSGTMFFRNCYRVRELLRHWEAQCYWEGRGKSDQWEGPILDSCLKAHEHIRVGKLPLSYSTIFDGPQPEEPVVIRHWQASRQLKEEVAPRDNLS